MKENKRDKIVKFRLTNLEYEALAKASKSSKCMSDYFRQRVFRKGVGLYLQYLKINNFYKCRK